jgi:hypothetical protein
MRVIQVALNIPDRICSDHGEVAIKPGANGVSWHFTRANTPEKSNNGVTFQRAPEY